MGKRSKKVRKTNAEFDAKASKKHILDWSVIGISIAILICAFAIYWGSTDYGLVYLDDNKHIIGFSEYNSKLEHIDDTFTKLYYGNFYRPILTISYIIDTNLFGKEIQDYRYTNILLHGLGGMLVFLILIQLRFQKLTSAMLSLLLLAHPILTPAVAWVPGRNDSMLAVFVFLSLLFYLKYKETERYKGLYWGIHILSFAIAIFTKEVAAIFPIAILLYTILVRKENPFKGNNFPLLLGWAFVGIIWFSLRSIALSRIISIKSQSGIEPFLINLPSIPAITGKIFLPAKMAGISNFDPLSIITGIIMLIVISVLLIMSRKKDLMMIFWGIIWFFLFMLPPLFYRLSYVEGFMDYAEHRAYVPILGLVLFVAQIIKSWDLDRYRNYLLGIGAIALIALLYVNLNYQPKFKDRITYWGHNINVYPDKPRAYSDLSIYFYEKKQFKKAESLLRQALKLNNDEPYCNFNLGKVFLEQRKLDSAEKYLSKAYSKNLKNDWAIDYGTIFMLRQDYNKALEIFKKAFKQNPNDDKILVNMGAAYAYLKNLPKAIESWELAISKNSKAASAYNNLIRLHSINGNKSEVIRIANLGSTNQIPFDKDVYELIRKAGI